MGSSTSRPQQQQQRTHRSSIPDVLSSPSRQTSMGAFGRLRIDSPKQQNGPQQRRLSSNDGAGAMKSTSIVTGSPNNLATTAAASMMLPTATEATPLTSNNNNIPPKEPALLLETETATESSPPLAVWIGPALACALAYALYNIFIKKGSASINPILGGVILQFVAAIFGCILLAGVYTATMQNSNIGEDDDDSSSIEDMFNYDRAGIGWAILAGVAVGAAEMVSFYVSGMGVQAIQSIPIIIGGSVMFGTLLGYVALGETLTLRGWTGVLLISIGISLVGMDDEGEMH